MREGKILGNYIKQHFKGKKVGFFYQDDEFGQDGLKGLTYEVPKSQIVSKQSYDPTNTKIGPQIAALKAAGAQVVVSFTVPAFTAIMKLTMLGLKYNPQLVVSDVGSDPITLAGLLASFAKNKTAGFGNSLTQGIITDALPAVDSARPATAGSRCSHKIHQQYLPEAPAGRQRPVRALGRLHLRPGHVQGRPEPDQAGPDRRDQRRPAAGRLGRAVRLLSH